MKITEKQVLDSLRQAIDPDLKKDLVSLNMISELKIDNNKISFLLVLTTPACPLKESLKKACIQAIHDSISPSVEVEVTFSSNVTSRREASAPILPDVKNIIAVASGKGGVGKSTIAVNLAVALAASGSKVGLVDADIYGPSIPKMFGMEDARLEAMSVNGQTFIKPIEKYGVKLISIAFFIESGQALIWRGPMASKTLMQLFTETWWGELDYLVVDMPPGTGDIHITLAQSLPVTGAIIVSTPQEVALVDARKAVSMFKQDGINVPVLGFVENMSFFTPPELPENKYFIFGKQGCRTLAGEVNLPVLGEVPIVEQICDSGDKGMPVALDDGSPVAKAFKKIAINTAQRISITNAIKAE